MAQLHFAFLVSLTGPVKLPWMKARFLYFPDPDGHALEFCAV
jgi:hypothetical protein